MGLPDGSDKIPEQRSRIRRSGYANRLFSYWYGISHPFYDVITWWGFLPLGGERAIRRQIVDWLDVRPGNRVLSLCCGTGTTELAMVERISGLDLVGMDLGKGQIARARRKDAAGRIHFMLGDASRTGMPDRSFDRVAIVLALHEMPRELRIMVLKEAARTCKRDGRVIAVEHAEPRRWMWRALRFLMWFYWLPGNPEYATTMDLQSHGLAREMTEAGLNILDQHNSKMEWIETVIARPT